MMDYRLKKISPAPWRIVRAKAGDRLDEGLHRLIALWAAGRIDPLSVGDPIATALGSIGGRNTAANRTVAERSDAARRAVQARWAQYAKKTGPRARRKSASE